MDRPEQVAIAGAGIVGLACALALRRRGIAVTLLEAGTPMREASWAAGGMLAVHDPENRRPLQPLSRYSRSLYDAFLHEIAAFSAQQVRLRTSQTLQLVPEAHATPEPAQALTNMQAADLVPGLRAAPAGHQFWLLEEASLNPRDLCTALPSAARAAGAMLHEQTPVQAVEVTESGVRILTPRGAFLAGAFVNCAGAWSAMLDPRLAVSPRKGQMLTVEQRDRVPLTSVLRSVEVYLIPRGDGRIAIGATVEDAGFSKSVEPEALERLRERAAALFPAVRRAPLVESWAGLRPSSADDLPVIDCVGSRVFAATGHYRNGILLAPGTAEAVADLICGVRPAIDLAPFRAHRNPLRPSCDKHFVTAL